jgi:hypothetical protein
MASGQRLISCLHPCSTSNVALNTRTSAHGPLMGHPNWAECEIHTPSKNSTSSSVQLTRPVPTHTPCRVPYPRPTRACICPHTDPSKCPGTFPLSARPYVQCRPICHAPTKAAPPSPSVGASTRTHSTLLTLSSSLRVKGLTRGWYG